MGTHKEHKKHHHSHKRSHSSSRRHSSSKSKHRHHKKHHHHHHHHHKKSHHKDPESIELELNDKELQNALDCLEAGALNAVKAGSGSTPEAQQVPSNDDGGTGDSDTDSNSSGSLPDNTDTNIEKKAITGEKYSESGTGLKSERDSKSVEVKDSNSVGKAMGEILPGKEQELISGRTVAISIVEGVRGVSEPVSTKVKTEPVSTKVKPGSARVEPEAKTTIGTTVETTKEVRSSEPLEASVGVVMGVSLSHEVAENKLQIIPKNLSQRATIKINIGKNIKASSEGELSTAKAEPSSNLKSAGDARAKLKEGSESEISKSQSSKRQSRSRSSSREKKKGKYSHSSSRHRSHSRSRDVQSRSGSRRHNSRSRSRHRQSRSGSRHHHSRSRSRHHQSHSRSRHHRSRSRSSPRRSHSGSRHHYRSQSRLSYSGSKRYRSRSRDSRQTKRRKSRSRSRDRHRSKRSRSRSRSRHRSYTRSRSRSKSPKIKSKPLPIPAIMTKSMEKKKTISKLTDFCKDLQKKQNEPEHEQKDDNKQAALEYRAPFVVNPLSVYQPGLIFHNNAWKTSNQIVSESNTQVVGMVGGVVPPLTDRFPVSAGLQHKSETQAKFGGQQQSVDIGDMAIQRVIATERLKVNPGDIEAINILATVQQKTQVWAESKVVPGRFTGEQKLTPLTMADHKIGFQAWAKKNMFKNLAPVMSGFGMKMLKKMGWNEGKPLGMQGVGHTEPIPVVVKLDRSGLATGIDKKAVAKPVVNFMKPNAEMAESSTGMGKPIKPSTVMTGPTLVAADAKSAHLIQGKHPVSVLQEISSKKRWGNPNYKMVNCEGPEHLKTFLFEVTIPLGTFRSANASKNKKQAKMEAASAALQAMGLAQKTH